MLYLTFVLSGEGGEERGSRLTDFIWIFSFTLLYLSELEESRLPFAHHLSAAYSMFYQS